MLGWLAFLAVRIRLRARTKPELALQRVDEHFEVAFRLR